MNKTSLLLSAAFIGTAGFALAQDNPMVGGAEMMPDMTIVENASNADNLTTLVQLVTDAGLAETLSGEGPFTVFAPTNEAFDRISDESMEALAANPEQLAQVLTCHVVGDSVEAAAILEGIEMHEEGHPVETLGGCTLTATLDGETVVLTDANGRTANVIQADVMQSNGVVHVIDRVLLPEGQGEADQM